MIELVVSGGQTGVDQAGWRAAKRFGIRTCGYMPKRFMTEAGPRPEFEAEYDAQEHESPLYPPRTKANAAMADATFWFKGKSDSRGYYCTENACRAANRPIWVVGDSITAEKAVRLINGMGYKSLNIAGNRESALPGVGQLAEAFFVEMFGLLGHEEVKP